MRTFRIGLVMAALLGVADLAALGAGGGNFPPAAVGLTDALLGVLTLIGVVLAWQGRRAWVGVVAARVVSALTALPAFLLSEVPVAARVAAAAFVALTAVAVILLVRTAPARVPAG